MKKMQSCFSKTNLNFAISSREWRRKNKMNDIDLIV